jgi:hypothetical protein
MTDQLKELQEQIAASEQAHLAKWRGRSGVTHTARELYKNLEAAASQAKMAANTAQSKVDRLRADDLMPVAGKRRLVAEALAQGKADVKKHTDRMAATLLVLDAELGTAALPRLDPQREAFARDELRLRLDGAADPVAVLFELAQGDGELAAVAVSSYGESYLRAKGIPRAKEAHAGVRNVAAAYADQSADPARRAIGEARAELPELHKAQACTISITRTALQAAEGAALEVGVKVAEG